MSNSKFWDDDAEVLQASPEEKKSSFWGADAQLESPAKTAAKSDFWDKDAEVMSSDDQNLPEDIRKPSVELNQDKGFELAGIIGAFGQTGKITKQAYDIGKMQVVRGRLGAEAALGKVPTEQFIPKLQEVESATPESNIPEFRFTDPNSIAANIAGEITQLLPFMLEVSKSALAHGAAGAGTGAATGSIVPGIGTLAGTVAGAKIGANLGIIKESAIIEGGNLYADLIKDGVSHETARNISIPVGLFTGVIETTQFGVMTRRVPGLNRLFKKKLAEKVIESQPLRDRLIKVGTNYLTDIAEQTGQESIQELSQIGGEVLAKTIEEAKKDKDFDKPGWKEVLTRMGQVLKTSALAFPVLQLPGAAIETGRVLKSKPSESSETEDSELLPEDVRPVAQDIGGTAEEPMPEPTPEEMEQELKDLTFMINDLQEREEKVPESFMKRRDALQEILIGGESRSVTQDKNVLPAVSETEVIEKSDIQDAVDQYASYGAGFSKEKGKTLGLERLMRETRGEKKWEDKTAQERKEEILSAIKDDFEIAKEQIQSGKEIDYLLDRALDPLDPMKGVYTVILKKIGAEVTPDGGIKITDKAKKNVAGIKGLLSIESREKKSMSLNYEGKNYPIESIEQAQDIWNQVRDEAINKGLSVHDMNDVPRIVDRSGKTIAHITWNGSVRDGEPGSKNAADEKSQALKEAEKAGKVIGIDADTKLPIIDTKQTPDLPRPAQKNEGKAEEAPKKKKKKVIKSPFKMDLSDFDVEVITSAFGDDPVNAIFDQLTELISMGEAGFRKPDEHGKWFGVKSSFPKWFKNKGYTKKESLAIIEKARKGEAITEKQHAILTDLLNGMLNDEVSRYETEKLSEEKGAEDQGAEVVQAELPEELPEDIPAELSEEIDQKSEEALKEEELSDVLKALEAIVEPNGNISRGGDYIRSLIEGKSEETLQAVGSWARQHKSNVVRRQIGDVVSAQLRALKAIKEESQAVTLDPVFSDIHKQARRQARDDLFSASGDFDRKTEGVGMPNSVMRGQWDLAYDDEVKKIYEERRPTKTLAPGVDRTIPPTKLTSKKEQKEIDLMGEKEAAAREAQKKQGSLFEPNVESAEEDPRKPQAEGFGSRSSSSRPKGDAYQGDSTSTGKSQAETAEDDLAAKLSKKIGGMEYVRAVESPELLKLAKELSGQNVTLNQRLISALGRFLHLDGPGGKGWIELAKTVFKNPKLAQGVLAHEIGHLIDWLPDETLKRGNILGRMASLLNYRKTLLPGEPGGPTLTDKDRARLRREAERIVQDRESGQGNLFEKSAEPTNQFNPDLVIGIWNSFEQSNIPKVLMDYVKGLGTAAKKSIIKAAYEAKKKGEPITIEEIENLNKDYEKNPQSIYEVYKDLLKQEVEKRKMYEEEVIKAELKALTKWWHPFDEASQTNPLTGEQSSYAKYRYSSRELYAEFISVLLNAPAKAKEMAPTAYEAFWNYLGEKEEVMDSLFKIQAVIQGSNDALFRQRESDIKGMFEKSEQMYRARQLRYDRAKKSNWFMLKNAFWDKNESLLSAEKEAKKQGAAAPKWNLQNTLEKRDFVTSIVRSHLHKLEGVYKEIQDKKLMDDVGVFMFAKRVMSDRTEMANPLGHTAKTAEAQLDFMKRTDPDRYAKIESLVKGKIQEWFKNEIIPLMKDIYTPEQIAKAMAAEDYAPFRVIDFMKDYVASGMMPQEGTLREISNPFASLIMKSGTMIGAAARNAIKIKIGNFIRQHPGLFNLQTAKITQYPGVFKIENAPDKTMGTISWREGGEWRAYHVDKWAADSFNGENDHNLMMAGSVLEKISLNSYARAFWLVFNLSFQVRNLFRDMYRLWKAHPQVTFGNVLKEYAKAFPSAHEKVSGQYNELVNQLEKAGVIGYTLNDLLLNESADETELQKFFERYDIVPGEKPKKMLPVIKEVSKLLDGIRYLGDVIEATPKIAGWQALKGLPEDQRAYITRNLVGTPNYRRGGTLKPIYNSIFIFSNVKKEAIRGMIELSSDPELKGQYWKKTATQLILSQMLMGLMLAGLFGKDDEERKKNKQMAENVTEYDKANFMVTPIGMNEKGETQYLRMPLDEDARLFNSLIWAVMKNLKQPGEMLKDVFSIAGKEVPAVGPVWDLMGKWGTFMQGQTPRDDWKGRDIVSRDQMAAGGWEAFEPMILYTVEQTGLFRFSTYDRVKDQGLWKMAIAMTPIVNTIYRETDYGYQEKLHAAAEKEAAAEARVRLDRNEMVKSAVSNGVQIEDLVKESRDKKEIKQLEKKFKKETLKKSENPLDRTLGRLTSNGQKVAVLEAAFDRFDSDKDFKAYLKEANNNGLISAEVGREALKRYRSKS